MRISRIDHVCLMQPGVGDHGARHAQNRTRCWYRCCCGRAVGRLFGRDGTETRSAGRQCAEGIGDEQSNREGRRGRGKVGIKGSPCELPVSFDHAADWTAEAVKEDTQFGLTSMGPVTLKCEIDAKPAGIVGFLRIWVGGKAGDDPNAVLKEFVAENAKDRKSEVFTKGMAGEFKVAEVSYLNVNEFLDTPRKERAFAFSTPKGVVVFDLGGMDSSEHDAMLPAYELARKTLTSN